MDETIKGLIADQGRTYGYDDPVRSRDLNRWQKDLARLSWALQKMGADLHYPHVATSDHKFQATASADKVSLDTGVRFILAGVPFDTSDLDSADLKFNIPDNSTRFLRVELASDCGAAILDDPADSTNKNWVVTRELKLSFSLVSGTEEDAEGTGGGPSSPESMRILKAVKAEAGTSPTITLYENSGHGHVGVDVDSANLRGGVKVYTASGTFQPGITSGVPSWVKWVWVEMVGAGGGGGYRSGSGWNGNAGSGGGGAFAAGWVEVDSETANTITVGAAGVAGTSGTVDGTDGGDSSFDTDVVAEGGYGGESTSSTAYGSGIPASGGLAANSVGDIKEDGGPGAPSGTDYYDGSIIGGCTRFGHLMPHGYYYQAENFGTVGPGCWRPRGQSAEVTEASAWPASDGTDGQVRVFWYGPISIA